MNQELAVRETIIPGLFEIDLAVLGDNRGWFKENYQKEKMEALGLPEFKVVQNNFSFNAEPGTTRGMHMEPWRKFISVANGSVFGSWIDLRSGPNYGTTVSLTIRSDKAVFVPLGVANGYQTLEANVVYAYLVDAHWSADATYTWPFSKDKAIVSDKDRAHPPFKSVSPIELHYE
jgi:dTDP-4-dehydrorhamnose 3,5-epimerase-like enzyme